MILVEPNSGMVVLWSVSHPVELLWTNGWVPLHPEGYFTDCMLCGWPIRMHEVMA